MATYYKTKFTFEERDYIILWNDRVVKVFPSKQEEIDFESSVPYLDLLAIKKFMFEIYLISFDSDPIY